jgi:hypothetical protein
MKDLSLAHLIPAGPEVAPGYKFDKAADLTNAAERERLSPAAIRAYLKICEKWGLSESEARALLGGIASSTFHVWRADPEGQRLSQDTLVRISLVIGIYKALHIYFSKAWADRWVRLGNRNALFAGRAPVDFMIRHGQPGMLEVRRMLDAWRGGR